MGRGSLLCAAETRCQILWPPACSEEPASPRGPRVSPPPLPTHAASSRCTPAASAAASSVACCSARDRRAAWFCRMDCQHVAWLVSALHLGSVAFVAVQCSPREVFGRLVPLGEHTQSDLVLLPAAGAQTGMRASGRPAAAGKGWLGQEPCPAGVMVQDTLCWRNLRWQPASTLLPLLFRPFPFL